MTEHGRWRWPSAPGGAAARALRRAAGWLLAWLACVGAGPVQAGDVMVLRIDGAIGPATADYVVRGIALASAQAAPLVVLEMDTPGGLDRSMREIVKAILASKVPVAGYVAPSGARAASAGTYILYATHVAAMAPGTNLGAATPVPIGVGGGGGEGGGPAEADGRAGDAKTGDAKPAAPAGGAMQRKATNDAVAYLRGLAELRGRNVAWAERAVREAASLPADEAVAMKVVDLVASDRAELLRRIDGRQARVAGGTVTLRTAGAGVVEHLPDWRTRLLATITDPSIALVLILLGVYGLFFEFSSPGFGVPGVVGAIALLLGLYSLHMLPVNYAGLALVFVGLLLMIGEVLVAGFGVLGIGGGVALAFGALILFDPDIPGMGVPLPFVASLALASVLLFSVGGGMVWRARRRPVVTGRETLVGSPGEVVVPGGGTRPATVRVQGALWSADASGPLRAGERVTVLSVDGLRLRVARAGDVKGGDDA